MYLPLILITWLQFVVTKENFTTRIVNTGNGAVCGKLVHSYGGYNGYAFLGIPYARPPIGELRFKAPQRVEPWSGVLDGTSYRPGCLADNLYNLFDPKSMPTEDCLYVNVFTSAKCMKKKDCPVLTYLYGGKYKYHSPMDISEEVMINNFANEDRNIVVVLLAFRGDLLGWINIAPTLKTSVDSNLSLRDNIAGLEWIQKEIRYFGGNTSRVTLMGHSSGAINAETLSYLPESQELFHQVVSMSAVGLGGDYSRIGNSKYSQKFAVRSGCATQDETFTDVEAVEKVLKCLRSLSEEQIISLLNNGKNETEDIIGPWIDGPSGIIPTYLEILRKSRPPVNMLIGTLTGELRDMRRIMTKNGTELVPERLLEYCDHLGHELQYEEPEKFVEICYLTYSKDKRTQMLDDDKTFYVRSINVANSLVDKANVYMYSYSYTGGAEAWSGFSSAKGFQPNHGQDLIYMMGWKKANFTERDVQIERIYSGMIANFVSNGDPSYGDYKWSKWTTHDMNYFHIDFDEKLVMPGNKVGYYKEVFQIWNSTFSSAAGKNRPLEEFARHADCFDMRTVLLNIASDYQKVSQTKKSLLAEEASYKSWKDFLALLKQRRRMNLSKRNMDLYNLEEINTQEGWSFGEWLILAGSLVLICSAMAVFVLKSQNNEEYISY